MVVRISSSSLPLRNNNDNEKNDFDDFAAKNREMSCRRRSCSWTFSPPRVERVRFATTRKRRATPFWPKSREMMFKNKTRSFYDALYILIYIFPMVHQARDKQLF